MKYEIIPAKNKDRSQDTSIVLVVCTRIHHFNIFGLNSQLIWLDSNNYRIKRSYI